MKKRYIASIVALPLAITASILAVCFAAPAPKAARSVHLHYAPLAQKPHVAEATVTVTETQTNSYFMAIGWDCGYCGLQDLSTGYRVLIFSVWEPGDPFDFAAKEADVAHGDRAKVLYAAENVDVARFEREGTGARTMANIEWKVGEPVSIRIVCSNDGAKRMKYSCYVTKPGYDWELMATISTLAKKEALETGFLSLTSFVEDFYRNGWSAGVSRRAEYSNIRTKGEAEGDAWVEAYAAMFTADNTPTMNVDAGITDKGAFFLQTGGATKNTHTPLGGVARKDQ